MENTIRKAIEYAIVKDVAVTLLKQGWKISVFDGESNYPKADNIIKILSRSFETDDLEFHCTKGKGEGWVKFTLGNGEDVLTDYSTNLKLESSILQDLQEAPDDLSYRDSFATVLMLMGV